MALRDDPNPEYNPLQKALLEYEATTLETALIEWTKEHWPMAARAMVCLLYTSPSPRDS